MEVEDLEKKIFALLKTGEKTTEEIEIALDKKSLDECSDKIVYALIRLKNTNKIINKFENKTNIWYLK